MLKKLYTVRSVLKSFENNSKCAVAVCGQRNNSAWTNARVIKSSYKNIEIPNTTLYEYVWQNLERWPERTVSVCATTGRGYTYEQAFKLSQTFAANLRNKFNIRDGDVVAVLLPNIPDYPIVTLGILEAGGIITSINPIYTSHEIERQLVMSGAKVVISLPETVKTIKDAINAAKINIPIISVRTNGGENAVDGTVLFNELSEDLHADKSCLKEVRRSLNDICFLPYSSGTTGMPKGVELSHRNIIANCEQINEIAIQCHNETTATHQDAVMTVLPLFHIYAATVIMFHKMSHGIKLVTLAKFQPDTFLRSLEKYKTNILFAAPPMILLMASHPAGTPQTYQYLDIIVNGAAPLSSTDADRFFEKSKRKLDFRQGYGLTETSPVVCMTPKGLDNYACVGGPIPDTEVKIVDNDLRTLGPNEKGELLVRGPQVMRGYKDNPQANTESFTTDGWFRTGDLAVADNDGIVTIADRLKELIKVKGFQVPPAELEAVLRSHQAVDDAAVIGVPHSTNGEAPKAFIVLKKENLASAKEICDFVKERVAPYKRVEDITFVDSIPKSSAGKILRKQLREKYC